jgi:uncharacterized protein (TIGR00297 family)
MFDLASALSSWTKTAAPSARQLWLATGMTLGFTLLARWLRGVTDGGAAVGAVICFLLYLGAGPAGFVALVSLFVLTWVTTRWGYQKKQRLGVAEKRDGRRATQVLANLGLAGLCALLHVLKPAQPAYLLAMAAALSEAAADTVSSEMGQVSADRARLITTWERVPAGSDGGVSPIGTLAGIVAAALLSLVCSATGILPWRWFGVSLIAAAAGMTADSYMGASLERRKVLNNDEVNFLSTGVAVAIALLLAG